MSEKEQQGIEATKPLTRRHWLVRAAGGVAVLALSPALLSQAANSGAKSFRIVALPGLPYPRSYLKFIQKARFSTFEAASAATWNAKRPVRILRLT